MLEKLQKLETQKDLQTSSEYLEYRRSILKQYLELVEKIEKGTVNGYYRILILPIENFADLRNLLSEAKGGYLVPKSNREPITILKTKIFSSKETNSAFIAELKIM